MSGNVTLEQQLPGDIAFQIAYVTNNAVDYMPRNIRTGTSEQIRHLLHSL